MVALNFGESKLHPLDFCSKTEDKRANEIGFINYIKEAHKPFDKRGKSVSEIQGYLKKDDYVKGFYALAESLQETQFALANLAAHQGLKLDALV